MKKRELARRLEKVEEEVRKVDELDNLVGGSLDRMSRVEEKAMMDRMNHLEKALDDRALVAELDHGVENTNDRILSVCTRVDRLDDKWTGMVGGNSS